MAGQVVVQMRKPKINLVYGLYVHFSNRSYRYGMIISSIFLFCYILLPSGFIHRGAVSRHGDLVWKANKQVGEG